MKNSIIEEYEAEGIITPSFRSKKIVNAVRAEIKKVFSEDDKGWKSMKRQEFQDLAVIIQNSINGLGIQKLFYDSEKPILKAIFGETPLLFESVVFFRAVRPVSGKIEAENPDFHRETMYSDDEYMKYVTNIWIPVDNVNTKNSLRYVPRSHLIPDENIHVEVDENWPGKVEKFSSGHKLGFLWKPKKIKSGVDLSCGIPIDFKINQYALFSSMLVHGGATNLHDKIRYAIGFGIIQKKKMSSNKRLFAAGGVDHFTELENV